MARKKSQYNKSKRNKEENHAKKNKTKKGYTPHAAFGCRRRLKTKENGKHPAMLSRMRVGCQGEVNQ